MSSIDSRTAGSSAAAIPESGGMINRIINPDGMINQRDGIVATSHANDTYGPDHCYVLTQTGAISVQSLTNLENGTPFYARLLQSQVAAHRMGYAQIIENRNAVDLRGKTVVFNARVQASDARTLRYAILEWTGVADAVTSDIVLDWASGTYTAGNFFLAANVTVAAVGSLAIAAATPTTLASITAAISGSCNNIIVFIWTQDTAAQNVTVDIAKMQLAIGSTAPTYQPRCYGEELRYCQRHCWKFEGNSYGFALGQAFSATQAVVGIKTPVTMFAQSTLSASGVDAIYLFNAVGAGQVGTGNGPYSAHPDFIVFTATVAAVLVAGNAAYAYTAPTGWIMAIAEL